MKRLIVLSGYGVYLRARKGLFQVVRKGSKPEEIPPVEVDAIIVDTKAASISSSAVLLAAKLGVDILFYDGWRPAARLLPATYGSTLKTWVKQLHAAKKRRAELARGFAQGKIYNQRQVLYRILKTKPARKPAARAAVRDAVNTATSALTRLGDAATVPEIRQLEAQAARAYWKAYAATLPSQLGFKTRIKRYTLPKGEAPDPFNIALNLGYALLLREAWRAAFAAGLNPYYGFLHARRPGRMSLVLDLMEEFRPVGVDYPLYLQAHAKTQEMEKLPEDPAARRLVWSTIWGVLVAGGKSLRPAIQTQARRLAEALNTGRPYKPYFSPW